MDTSEYETVIGIAIEKTKNQKATDVAKTQGGYE